jgi:hypothetical protein
MKSDRHILLVARIAIVNIVGSGKGKMRSNGEFSTLINPLQYMEVDVGVEIGIVMVLIVL